ncbi:MAG: hypothetical protein ACOX66_04570 [Oscillospiraceae bacterium]|jgi:hypothetical protein
MMWQWWGGKAYDGITGNVDSNYCYQAFPIKQPEETPAPAPKEPWHAQAQKWAVENKITDGARPDDAVTRAELWAMLYQEQNATIKNAVSELDREN